MSDPTMRALLACADDDGPTPLELAALRARIDATIRSERRRRALPVVLGSMTVAAAVVVAIVMRRPPERAPITASGARPVDAAVDARIDASVDAAIDAAPPPPDASLGPTITIETDPKNDVYVDEAFKSHGTYVAHGRLGHELIAGCERFDTRTYQHYKPAFIRMKFKAGPQTVTCKTTPPPRGDPMWPGRLLTWDSQHGWVPVDGIF